MARRSFLCGLAVGVLGVIVARRLVGLLLPSLGTTRPPTPVDLIEAQMRDETHPDAVPPPASEREQTRDESLGVYCSA